MPEPSPHRIITGNLALARTTFLQILKAGGITDAHNVRAHIACGHSSLPSSLLSQRGRAGLRREGQPGARRLSVRGYLHFLCQRPGSAARRPPQQENGPLRLSNAQLRRPVGLTLTQQKLTPTFHGSLASPERPSVSHERLLEEQVKSPLEPDRLPLIRRPYGSPVA